MLVTVMRYAIAASLAVVTVNAFALSPFRIAVISLKNFGDTKATDPPRLEFIADRIAEQAVKGVAVVDELQDIDGSAIEILREAVTEAARTPIVMRLSARVGDTRKEQYGFFWNPEIISVVKDVETSFFDEISRDPAVITLQAFGAFDFTLVAFHTRPSGQDLKAELAHLDEIFAQVQASDLLENDIIFVGDFNAPPDPLPGQSTSVLGEMDEATPLEFAITTEPTNVLQTKLYDNIFFDPAETDEYITGPQPVKISTANTSYQERWSHTKDNTTSQFLTLALGTVRCPSMFCSMATKSSFLSTWSFSPSKGSSTSWASWNPFASGQESQSATFSQRWQTAERG